ncbi:MAG: ribonuclease D [Acidimicrobiales bacterium]
MNRRKAPSGYRWIDDNDEFAEILDELLEADRYALDTEFHRERSYYPQLALLQVAFNSSIVLVDPLAVDLQPLRKLMESDVLAVMHAGSQDLEVLEHACGSAPRRFYDTQVAAGFLGYSTPSLTSLVASELDVRLGKGDRLTDWLRRPLGQAQRDYAAQDVQYLLEILDRQTAALEKKGRLEWALDECAQLLARDRSSQRPETAWLRIKEVKHLRGKARGVAKELAEWREERARATDQPVRFVLSDLALVGIAQSAPSAEKDLRSIRGLDGRHLKDGGAAKILEAVQRGLLLDPKQLKDRDTQPTAALERDLRPAVTLISAWVSQFAREQSLDSSLLATRADIEAFLRGDANARLKCGWRSELAGQRMRDLVDGRTSLAFDRRQGLVMEPRFGRNMLES